MNIGILSTHPIQYQAPLFKELAKREGINLTVYFCHKPTAKEQGEGFGVSFEWDVDLLKGYEYYFIDNVSCKPTQGFRGYDTPELTNILHQKNFDFFIVHGWSNKASWQAFRACWSSNTKLAVRSDSQLQQGLGGLKSSAKNTFKKLLYPLFIGRFYLCLPYGQRSSAYFKQFGGKRIVISPHFIDNNFFREKAKPLTLVRSDLRIRRKVPDQTICFLYCGKFQSKKRPMDILQALKVIKEMPEYFDSSVHLLMVGDGTLRQECEVFANQSKLPVTFTGFLNQTEIVECYVVSDCLVLASDDSETWGLVVNEAMACGLTAIVSEVCGCVPDLILEGETGFTYPVGDIDQLAKNMLSVLNNKLNTQQMGNNARRHINGFSVERAANEILNEIL